MYTPKELIRDGLRFKKFFVCECVVCVHACVCVWGGGGGGGVMLEYFE